MNNIPTAVRYDVLSTPSSEQAELAHLLNHVALKGGRVINVVWVPTRSAGSKDQGPGYVLIVEYPKR